MVALRSSARTGVISVNSGRQINGAYLAIVDSTKLFFPDYQRDAIKHHVANIAGNWDNELARPLLVSLREGRLNVVDGRQTSAAAAILGKTRMLALVWTTWTYEREALAFFIHNDIPKKMSGWKRFQADLKSGNQANERILNIIHTGGLTTPFYPGVDRAKNADLSQIGVVKTVYRLGADPLLVAFVKVLRQWKRNNNNVLPVDAKATDLQRGLRAFLNNHTDDLSDVVEDLRHLQPAQIRARANTMPSRGRIDASQFLQAFESLTRAIAGR